MYLKRLRTDENYTTWNDYLKYTKTKLEEHEKYVENFNRNSREELSIGYPCAVTQHHAMKA